MYGLQTCLSRGVQLDNGVTSPWLYMNDLLLCIHLLKMAWVIVSLCNIELLPPTLYLTCHPERALAVDYWIACTQCGNLVLNLLIGYIEVHEAYFILLLC